jgi:hypothetical protein
VMYDAYSITVATAMDAKQRSTLKQNSAHSRHLTILTLSTHIILLRFNLQSNKIWASTIGDC